MEFVLAVNAMCRLNLSIIFVCFVSAVVYITNAFMIRMIAEKRTLIRLDVHNEILPAFEIHQQQDHKFLFLITSCRFKTSFNIVKGFAYETNQRKQWLIQVPPTRLLFPKTANSQCTIYSDNIFFNITSLIRTYPGWRPKLMPP